MKRWNKKNALLSIVFFTLFVSTVVISELDVLGQIDSIDVVVANDAIRKDAIIQKEDVSVKSFPRELYHEGMITDPKQVIGKRTTQSVAPSSFISGIFLDHGQLRPTENHKFFPIPNSWLMQLQGTLRRYDKINILAVPVIEERKEGEENYNKASRNFSQNEQGEDSKYILKEVPVAYVKSTQNKEVIGRKYSDDRINANANPSQIQLSLTPEQYLKLSEIHEEGFKFVFSY